MVYWRAVYVAAGERPRVFEASRNPIGNRFKRGFSWCCGSVPGDVVLYGG